VNDGSTDYTGEVIKGYEDDRIRYYEQENSDAYNALNKGLGLAKGRFISIINSDDVYATERLSFLLECIQQRNSKFIITDVELIGEDSCIIEDKGHWFLKWYERLKDIYRQSGCVESALLSGNIAVSTSNFFFDRNVVEKVGLFRPYRYAHDYDYVLRSLEACGDNFLFVADRKLLSYRIHGGNTIQENRCAVYEETLSVLIDYVASRISNAEDREFIISAMKLSGKTNIFELNKRDFSIKDLTERLDRLTGTISWKITKPLRSLGKFLTKNRNG
jgi:glycosyltransferase involved in cell wall biosynthesis